MSNLFGCLAMPVFKAMKLPIPWPNLPLILLFLPLLNGEKVEEWAEAELLSLIHNPKLPKSFNSGRWQKGSNPDLIFVSSNISQQSVKNVCNPIPNTQQ